MRAERGSCLAACPTCGKDLTYIAQYDRWYCFAEAKYAPKDFREDAPVSVSDASESHEGHYHCPSCGKELSFIEQYNRYYCYAESKYAPRDVRPVSGTPEAAAPLTTPAPEPSATETRREEVTSPVETSEPAPAVAAEPGTEPVAPSPVETPVSEPPREVIEQQSQPSEDAKSTPMSESPSEADAESSETAKPKLERGAVTKAKKAKLVEWSKAYGIDAMGSRTVLRDRLLQYMDEHRLDETEEEAEQEAEEPAEVIPAVEPTSVAPATETPTEEPAKIETEPEPTTKSVKEPEPTSSSEPEPEPEVIVPADEPRPEPLPTPPVTVTRMDSPSPAPTAAPAEPAKATPQPVPAPPTTPVVEGAKPLPCPTCGKDLTYIAQYDRLYCYAEGKYAPKDYGKATAAIPIPEPPKVPDAPKAAPPSVAPTPAPFVAPAPRAETKVSNPCPTCGRELRYVKDYDRWWCDSEKKYAPKDYGRRNACPTCGKELTWIPEYQRWYCYAEFKYAPKTMAPPAAGAAQVAVARTMPASPTVRAAPAAAATAATTVVSGMTRAEHLHGRPGAGIALAAMGFSLLILQNLVTGIFPIVGVVLFDPTSTDGIAFTKILIMLGFVGLLLALAGIVVGLRSVRSR
ncbi:MAG: hypothetical protein E6K18_06065 [Methanobacteriota archaeon]|nr:MAG: hypothetical protein E6K18_06065 [Euryarchaeota archaeon]